MSNFNQGTEGLRSQHQSPPPYLSICFLTAIPRCLCLIDSCFNFDVLIKSYTKRYTGEMN